MVRALSAFVVGLFFVACAPSPTVVPTLSPSLGSLRDLTHDGCATTLVLSIDAQPFPGGLQPVTEPNGWVCPSEVMLQVWGDGFAFADTLTYPDPAKA